MNDDLEKLHRERARALATDLMRDPVLALQYRDMIFDSFEDTASERLVTKWMTQAGYATRPELLRDELVNAPTTNLAAWDGAYVIQVDKGILVSLQIDGVGVRLNGSRVSSVTFTDGVLRFDPSVGAPWGGELRFSSVTPMADWPLSSGGTFQRKCTGRLWKDKTAIPSVANADGATKRIELPPSPPDVTENVVVRSRPAASLLGGPNPSRFVAKWKGDYALTQVSKDPDTGGDVTKLGPDFGIAGETDTKVKLSYIDPFEIDVTAIGTQPVADHIVYTGGARAFDLTFGEFGDGVRGFSGKIYPADAAVPPTDTNVTAVARSEVTPPTNDGGAIIDVGLAIAIGTFVAAIGGIIAVVVGVKYADHLTAQREYEKAVAGHNATSMAKARTALNDSKIILEGLPATTTSNISDIGLFGEAAAKESWAKEEVKRIDTASTQLQTDTLQFERDLIKIEGKITTREQGLRDATERLEKTEFATERDKRDARDRVDSEQAALDNLKDRRTIQEGKRDDLKKEHEKLAGELEKVHKLRF
jgi:hypothetical protein